LGVESNVMELFFEKDTEVQVGVDEAGRGCMIGPVVAAAVIWDPNAPFEGIKDSKKISRKKRAELRRYIETSALAFGVGMATNEEIDEHNILNATYMAMHRALDQIQVPFDRILVDGDRFLPYRFVRHNCQVNGDDRFVAIAAASILAKEHHDEWILNRFANDEVYDLVNNRGYGTKKHMEALASYGLTSDHRRSFCKKFL
jgi:ribonuclease HII